MKRKVKLIFPFLNLQKMLKVKPYRTGKRNLLEKVPRIYSKQTNRADQPSSTPSEYYKRSFTIPVIGHLEDDLNARFAEKKIENF